MIDIVNTINTGLIKREIDSNLAKVTEIDRSLSRNLDKADHLKVKAQEKHSAGWSWGGKDKRVAIEALQEVTSDMADCQIDIIRTQKDLYEGQKAMTQQMRALFQIGAMSITSNRMVCRELKMRLEHASREELSDLAREELLATIKQLEQMQDMLSVQERQNERIREQDKKIKGMEQKYNLLKQKMDCLESGYREKMSALKRAAGTVPTRFKVMCWISIISSLLGLGSFVMNYLG